MVHNLKIISGHLTDIISIVAIIIILFSVRYSFLSRKSVILDNYLTLYKEIEHAQEIYKNCDNEKKNYYFISLLNLLETFCFLYNKNLMPAPIKKTLKLYLGDLLKSYSEDTDTRQKINQAKTNSHTFEQLNSFCKKNTIKLFFDG